MQDNLSVGNVIDLSNGEGKLLKRVLRETAEGAEQKGMRPEKGDRCFVHYVGTLARNGEEFDSSRKRGEPLEFKLGGGQVISGWDEGVASMCVGELAVLTCAPEYAYGEGGAAPAIGPNETLNFEVELVDVIESMDRPAKRLEVVMRHRAKGNEMFKQESYAQAFFEYDDGVTTLEQLPDIDSDEEVTAHGLDAKEVRELRLALYSNGTFALYKDQKYTKAVEFGKRGAAVAERVGACRSLWVKILFRLGCSEMECHDYDNALQNLEKGLAIEKSSPECDSKMVAQFTRSIALAKKKKTQLQNAEKSMYGKMFQ
eukprot:Nk52_evm20s245 gene=Nk52_evmTU20s245